LSPKSWDFGKEVNKIKSSKRNVPSIVDDCNDENDIAEVFASKHMNLYSSIPFCNNDVDKLKSSINKLIDASDHNDSVIEMPEIEEAICKLDLNKSD